MQNLRTIWPLAFLCLIVSLVLPTFTAANDRSESDTLVICPDEFQRTLRPWVVHRQRQGHKIRVETTRPSAYENRLLVREVARESKRLKTIFIVGDSGDRFGLASRQVPTDYVQAKVNVKFGGDPEIASDNTLADLDDDQVPDLAIGRLPVDSREELAKQIERIIKYETTSQGVEWQRRINLVAGVGGFGQVIDKVIEQSTKQIVTDLIPDSYQTSMTYGSWSSPYCPDPRRFSETCLERFNEGCMFWVYIGHGNRHRLDKIYLPDQSFGIMSCASCPNLCAREGSPIAIFLACYTGAMDDARDCLAEEMIRQPGGPIAVLGGSRVTMPYAMSVLSLEMLNEYFDGTAMTLGELVLVAKQRMVQQSGSPNPYRNMIEGMGKTLSPKPELLEKERQEHVQLMHLIGDPLLKLKRPGKIFMQSPGKANAGQEILVRGQAPSDGKLVLEISYKRDRFRFRPPRRKEYDSSHASFASYQETYDKSRSLVCYRREFDVQAGPFTIPLQVPVESNGQCVITAIQAKDDQLYLASNPINIKAFERRAVLPGKEADFKRP